MMRHDAGCAQAEAANLRAVADKSGEDSLSSPSRAGDDDRLEYLTDMIAELRDMTQDMTQSSLPAILDSALMEARLYRARQRR